MNKIYKNLRNIPLLASIKSRVYRFLNIPEYPCFGSNFFFNSFKRNKNIKSLKFSDGLICGNFSGVGYFMKIRPKNVLESYLYLNGLWEPHILEIISSCINNQKGIMIDIGANVGATTIPIAKLNSKTTFHSFEPHPHIYQDLLCNVSFNKLQNVKTHNIAISDIDGDTLPFYAQKNSDNLGLSSFKLNHDITDYDIINVHCTSLDKFFENCEDRILVIKIDTQGYEYEALLSAKNILKIHKPIIIFEFESEYYSSQEECEYKKNIQNFLNINQYSMFMINHEGRYFPAVSFQGYFNGDIIALPLSSI